MSISWKDDDDDDDDDLGFRAQQLLWLYNAHNLSTKKKLPTQHGHG